MTGQHGLLFIFTNHSEQTCHLYGYPGVSLVDATGTPLRVIYHRGGDHYIRPAPPTNVNLAPGASGFFAVDKYRCDAGDLDLAETASIIPPDDTKAITVPIRLEMTMAFCGANDPGSTVAISPVEATSMAALDAFPSPGPN